MAAERILVIQLRQLGDILLTTPVLRAIKLAKPKANLTFLSHAMGQLVIDASPYVDEHFSFSDAWTLAQHWRLAKTLRQRRFDLVLDFMNNPRSALQVLATGAPARYGFNTVRRFAYTHVTPLPKIPLYIVREKFLLLAAAGIPPAGEQLDLPWTQAHTQPLMQFLAARPAIGAAPLRIVLSPTHRHEVRRWPLARYAALSDRLTREWGAAVMWAWGPGEEAYVRSGLELCRAAAYQTPATNFRELAALFANMDLFIGNSNGPSHVAVAADTPSLQLHGPTTAVSWCPCTERHRALQSPAFDLKTETGDIAAITSDAVWEELEAMRSVVQAAAAKRQSIGTRLTWLG